MNIEFDIGGIDTEGVNLWVLFMDAMAEFSNVRTLGPGGVVGYVARRYSWMKPEERAAKVEEVLLRCRVMERIRTESKKTFPGRDY